MLPPKWSEQSGLENIQGVIDGEFPNNDAMGQSLNFKLVSVREGECVYEGVPEKRHLNQSNNVHGGWAMSILDAAAVIAAYTALPKNKTCVTSSLEVKFARPIKTGMKCRAMGKVQSLGSNLVHSKAKLIDIETGKLLAFCTCSVSVFDDGS